MNKLRLRSKDHEGAAEAGGPNLAAPPESTHPSIEHGRVMSFGSILTSSPTMEEYREDYPRDALDDKSMNCNLQFYRNQIPSRPKGAKIDDIHKLWWQRYDLLEEHHGYIQWLFPLKEASRFNFHSSVMQRHEAVAIQNDKQCLARIVMSLRMMLNFWGAQLSPNDTDPIPKIAVIQRCPDWPNRFMNLRIHSHNNMRISRMLKCLGDVGLEHYKMAICKFFIDNLFGENAPLAGSSCVKSCKKYWVQTLRNDSERRNLEGLIKRLENSQWDVLEGEQGQELLNDVRDIGKRIAIYWPKDRKFYFGRIINILKQNGSSSEQTVTRYHVLYDTGANRQHILGKNGMAYCILHMRSIATTLDHSENSSDNSTQIQSEDVAQEKCSS